MDTQPTFDYQTYHALVNSSPHKDAFLVGLTNFEPVYNDGKANWNFLERIFEMDQSEKYQAQNGQIKKLSCCAR